MKGFLVTTMKTTASRFGILAVLFFESAIALSAVDVTLQVNMAVQTMTGNFNPGAHTVEVHGSFNSWGGAVPLSASPADPDIYQGTTNLNRAAGTQVQYKVVLQQSRTP